MDLSDGKLEVLGAREIMDLSDAKLENLGGLVK